MKVRNLKYIVDVIGPINTESRDRGGGGAGFLLGLIFKPPDDMDTV